MPTDDSRIPLEAAMAAKAATWKKHAALGPPVTALTTTILIRGDRNE
jgi:hypothetical protein